MVSYLYMRQRIGSLRCRGGITEFIFENISIRKIQRYLSDSLNQSYTSQVPPQLNCGDTCQIWTWYSTGNGDFVNHEKYWEDIWTEEMSLHFFFISVIGLPPIGTTLLPDSAGFAQWTNRRKLQINFIIYRRFYQIICTTPKRLSNNQFEIKKMPSIGKINGKLSILNLWPMGLFE